MVVDGRTQSRRRPAQLHAHVAHLVHFVHALRREMTLVVQHRPEPPFQFNCPVQKVRHGAGPLAISQTSDCLREDPSRARSQAYWAVVGRTHRLVDELDQALQRPQRLVRLTRKTIKLTRSKAGYRGQVAVTVCLWWARDGSIPVVHPSPLSHRSPLPVCRSGQPSPVATERIAPRFRGPSNRSSQHSYMVAYATTLVRTFRRSPARTCLPGSN